MSKTFTRLALLLGALLAGAASADTLPPPQNVLQLSAQASAEVPQDLLVIALAAMRDGPEAGAVQTQLRQLLDAALVEARKAVRPGQLDVRTGQFSVAPRYQAKGGQAGWQGVAELIIEGRDMVAISQLAGRLSGLNVTRIGFGLTREAREKVEAELTAQAIARFKARAGGIAQQFGFAGYGLREVTVGGGDGPMPVAMRRAEAMGGSMADAAQPYEAGKTSVTVTVQGSVQMSAR
jgi:predicted secreted protein